MRSRILSIGAWLLVATVAVSAAAEPKRPTGEEGGLFSLFTRGREKPEAEPDETLEEPPADAGGAVTEPVSPAEDSVAAPPAAEPVPPVEQAAPEKVEEPAKAEAEPERPATEETTAPVEPEAPATADEGEPEGPSVAAPAVPAEPPSAPVSEGPAWPDASDSGGTLAEQPAVAPEPRETPAGGVAAIAEPSSAEARPSGGRIDGAYATDKKDEPVSEREAKPEIAAREVPSGGSVAPGAVALPETEIQGEIEKPDIFFLLPKARDQSDDQVIRARIRREITQPLVKEWLEEMMLLK